MKPLIVAGIDPGRSGAIAIIRHDQGRSEVLGSWAIDGDSKRHPWFDRARDVVQLLVDESIRSGPVDLIVAEVPGGGGASRKPLQPVTWLTMGRCLGLVEGLLRVRLPGAVVMDVTSSEWPAALRLPVGKQPYQLGGPVGWHRVIEVGTRAQGGLGCPLSPDGLNQARADRRIACAEAALIAIAGAIIHTNPTAPR